MTQKPDYERGWRDGVRYAVTWLHNEADRMNDPHARTVLNTAAFGLGVDTSPKVRALRRRRGLPTEQAGNTLPPFGV